MNEILEALATRIKSPIFGYFVLSWVAFNWRPLFYLFFSNTVIDDRFQRGSSLLLTHYEKIY